MASSSLKHILPAPFPERDFRPEVFVEPAADKVEVRLLARFQVMAVSVQALPAESSYGEQQGIGSVRLDFPLEGRIPSSIWPTIIWHPQSLLR